MPILLMKDKSTSSTENQLTSYGSVDSSLDSFGEYHYEEALRRASLNSIESEGFRNEKSFDAARFCETCRQHTIVAVLFLTFLVILFGFIATDESDSYAAPSLRTQ